MIEGGITPVTILKALRFVREVGTLLSPNSTVKLDVPPCVGVPLIVPPVNESPGGNEPEKIDHTYGRTPPVPASA